MPKAKERYSQTKHKKWTMPKWMEPYRKFINNTGGNSVEDLMNNHRDTVFNNAPLAILCVAVKSEVALLETLHKEGKLSADSATD